MPKEIENKPEPKKRGRKKNPIYFTDGVFDQKKYQAINKATLTANVVCDCGAVLQKAQLRRHKKTKRHLSTMVVLNNLKLNL